MNDMFEFGKLYGIVLAVISYLEHEYTDDCSPAGVGLKMLKDGIRTDEDEVF